MHELIRRWHSSMDKYRVRALFSRKNFIPVIGDSSSRSHSTAMLSILLILESERLMVEVLHVVIFSLRQASISMRVICPSGRVPNILIQLFTRLRSVRADFMSGTIVSRYIWA